MSPSVEREDATGTPKAVDWHPSKVRNRRHLGAARGLDKEKLR